MSPLRRNRRFTLLLLDDQGRVRRVRFTSRAVRAVLAAIGVLALGGLFLLFGYVGDRFTIRRLEILQKPPAAPAMAETASPAEPAAEAPALPPNAETLAQAKIIRASMTAVERYFAAPIPTRLSRPDRWPLRGWTTSEFGRRSDPLSGEPDLHLGLDIAAPIGSEVRAPAAGEVLFAGERPGFGQLVALATGSGYVAYFGHLDRIVVAVGQNVIAGEPLGRSGNTGRTSGPHLHYEIRRFGAPVDPRGFLPDEGQSAKE